MFHSKNGWFFKRLENGRVAVEKRAEAKDTAPLVSYEVFTLDEWASIVASVSAKGELDNRWNQVRDFHNGETSEYDKLMEIYNKTAIEANDANHRISLIIDIINNKEDPD